MSLGREHIDHRRPVPRPDPIRLGDAVAALFGGVLPEEEGGEVQPAYRPNRETRRRIAKARRRRA